MTTSVFKRGFCTGRGGTCPGGDSPDCCTYHLTDRMEERGRQFVAQKANTPNPLPSGASDELVERVARAICGKDDPDELVAAGNPLGEYAEYPRWMLFQLDAKKIISDPRTGLENLATWFRFDASNGEFTGEYCSVKPHDAHGMEPMVHINYALAIAALSTPEASDTKVLEKLAKEYRPGMDKDVLHSWATDVVEALALHRSSRG